ncbi:MAG: hypothetical protein INR71_15110, partial [Terriglobus roseus]|nr:hypothetical protein [Terriglobus roseus]
MAISPRANAESFGFTLNGPGVSGQVTLTYGAATDARYNQAYEITGVSGTFTDTNNGLNIVNAPITGLEGLNSVPHEPTNLLTPADFSGFAIKSGLPAQEGGYLHYDNLLWPGGSQGVATDYDYGGGVFDIYGVLFDIGNGRVVNLWSNGVAPFAPVLSYGVAVATKDTALDYVSTGVNVT